MICSAWQTKFPINCIVWETLLTGYLIIYKIRAKNTADAESRCQSAVTLPPSVYCNRDRASGSSPPQYGHRRAKG